MSRSLSNRFESAWQVLGLAVAVMALAVQLALGAVVPRPELTQARTAALDAAVILCHPDMPSRHAAGHAFPSFYGLPDLPTVAGARTFRSRAYIRAGTAATDAFGDRPAIQQNPPGARTAVAVAISRISARPSDFDLMQLASSMAKSPSSHAGTMHGPLDPLRQWRPKGPIGSISLEEDKP